VWQKTQNLSDALDAREMGNSGEMGCDDAERNQEEK